MPQALGWYRQVFHGSVEKTFAPWSATRFPSGLAWSFRGRSGSRLPQLSLKLPVVALSAVGPKVQIE
jgi:hypothetical protein